jgi:C4-dicarboxylate-specific signal transduction histidine kinase
VFLKLILNAAEAGGDLAIEAAAEGADVRIAFRDTGGGMSNEQLGKLFDPFYCYSLTRAKDRGPWRRRSAFDTGNACVL